MVSGSALPNRRRRLWRLFSFLCSNQALFNVRASVPISDALAQASDFLFIAKALTVDAAYAKDTDRHAWAAHYLTVMSKAVIDDVVKVLTR